MMFDGRFMQRHILSSEKIHAGARAKVGSGHREIVEDAQRAIENNEWVVFGMRQNPIVKKARTRLAADGLAFEYIEHGSYLKEWRKRNSLKMWTGWPTFPMVFHQGMLIGGAEELDAYLSGSDYSKA